MSINKIKSIDSIELELPIGKGLYAFTGQNGSGKSTISSCASSVFFYMKMTDFFGHTDNDASISFELNGGKRYYKKFYERDRDKWKWTRKTEGDFKIKGFFEGSLIYGNRFRNTNYNTLRKLEFIDEKHLKEAPEFIRTNLGEILHNDINFYPKLFTVKNEDLPHNIHINGDIFYYEKSGKKISQFHMSTGENLLISILNSLNIRNSDRTTIDIPCLLMLDEIELALHPSSLKRLVVFLRKMSDNFNYAIYFSTHSLEIISSINPDNIFFIDRHIDNSLEIINPCYPAYATKILYDQSGYDYVILVEDDLASIMINRLLRNNSLLNNKLIHVLPCGGYSNVIDLAQDVVVSNLMGRNATIMIILDADVKTEAASYISKNGISNNIPINFLPVESLEKFLRDNLFKTVDHKLYRTLEDYIFHQVSLRTIIEEYKNSGESLKDNNGKKLYNRIDSELRNRNKSRNDIIEVVIRHVEDNQKKDLNKIITFLRKKLIE
ncbi:AAA family ATPase [Flammeovirga sp. OC4]|uniref:AAA family ATPase n=1 Tax=Flammeovirga sp. OC4 TaxID=1382345 RepID=UPI001C1270B2|nr:AAA family ATPase [Flammeovirga sp. OC4]